MGLVGLPDYTQGDRGQMPKPSVIIPILLILLIVAAGGYWIISGAASKPGAASTSGAAATTPRPGDTPVRAQGAAIPVSGAAPTQRPAAATKTPAPAAASSGDVQLASNEILYQVKQGDTLWAIAQTYDTTVQAIAKRNNNIVNPNRIYVGQRIIVPKGVAPTPTPAGQVVYFVEWGDTLWDIARRYGTTVDAIAAANNVQDPNRIYVGQRLVIPQPAVG